LWLSHFVAVYVGVCFHPSGFGAGRCESTTAHAAWLRNVGCVASGNRTELTSQSFAGAGAHYAPSRCQHRASPPTSPPGTFTEHNLGPVLPLACGTSKPPLPLCLRHSCTLSRMAHLHSPFPSPVACTGRSRTQSRSRPAPSVLPPPAGCSSRLRWETRP
jgi:hypothetical protein